ncbi:hypothetical protein CEXT_523501 [Caerostris extrusa]|uniref:Uncharacterized protein n=1 Tax=Caerostris extrusa TaxID=172846 RepID=A0AAV4ML75_CAEEX|nr:hypothetical protein CEXT_523501 [Caerostris extrusa]
MGAPFIQNDKFCGVPQEKIVVRKVSVDIKRRLLAAEKILRRMCKSLADSWRSCLCQQPNHPESNSLVASIHAWISRSETGAPFIHDNKSHHKRRLLCAKFPWT